MNTRASAVGVTILLASVISIAAFAQDREDGSPEASLAKCVRTQCIMSGEIVTGAPFSAEATTEWRSRTGGSSPMRATTRYYRHSDGRLRVEQGFAGDARPPQVFLIPDVSERGSYVVDPVTRTMTAGFPRGLAEMMIGGGGWNRFIIPLAPNRFWGFHHVPVADPEAARVAGEESLGVKYVAGVQAIGTRFSTRLPLGIKGVGLAERWVSPDLKVVVYSRSEDAEIGVVEYKLTKIDRTEPRANLFEVPEDYSLTRHPVEGQRGLTWQNPYFPKLASR